MWEGTGFKDGLHLLSVHEWVRVRYTSGIEQCGKGYTSRVTTIPMHESFLHVGALFVVRGPAGSSTSAVEKRNEFLRLMMAHSPGSSKGPSGL